MDFEVAAILAWVAAFSLSAVASCDEPTRLVSETPQSGRCVKTDHGFMIPYTEQIPGTNVTFEMVPVVGLSEPFWIGSYEVTAAEFHEFMKLDDAFRDAMGKQKQSIAVLEHIDAISAPTRSICSPGFRFRHTTGPRSPAASMTRYAARQYTKWLSMLIDVRQYRLPTESEWEHACRAGTSSRWSFGTNPSHADEYAVCRQSDLTSVDGAVPQVVGSRKPNAWGIYDMHGNVGEWVLNDCVVDRQHPHPDDSPEDSGPHFHGMIFKGGSAIHTVQDCDVEKHLTATEAYWDCDPNYFVSPHWLASEEAAFIGFRIVSPLQSLSREKLERYWTPNSSRIHLAVRQRLSDGRGTVGLVGDGTAMASERPNDSGWRHSVPAPWSHDK